MPKFVRIQPLFVQQLIFSYSLFEQELDGQLATAIVPIHTLEEEQRQFQSELNAKTSEAQKRSQELNRNADRLDQVNKIIDESVLP